MIRVRDGRSKSIRTRDEQLGIITKEIESLTPEERDLLSALMREVEGGSTDILEVINSSRYKRPVVSMREFIESEYYMGKSTATLYPKIKEDLIELFSTPGYREVVLTGSIGYGKTTFLSIAICRMMYELSCLVSPHLSYGLSPGSEIVLCVVSKSLPLARTVMKSAVDDKLKLSPYFGEQFKPDYRRDSTYFPSNIMLTIGSCNTDRVLGMNVLGGAVDEVNFMASKGQVIRSVGTGKKTVAQYDLAEKTYASLVRRVKSRFLKAPSDLPGLMILCSSASTIGSFTDRKIQASLKTSDVFVRDYAAWHVKPANSFSGQTFRVLIGNDSVRSRIIKDTDPDWSFVVEDGARVIEVPVEYQEDFERDLESAIRDIAGISTHAISAFINRIEIVEQCVNEASHPFSVDEYTSGGTGAFLWNEMVTYYERKLPGGYAERAAKPKRNPEALRHVHIDPSLSGDSTGFAMGHIERWVEVVRRTPDGEEYTDLAPHIVIDFMLRINPPFGEQIYLPDIRTLVYDLMERGGYHVSHLTCDSYQSADTLQQMKQKGVKSKVISVDRTVKPYESLKTCLYEKRIEFYQYEPFIAELKALEYDRVKGKVDHPAAGTKDVSDAVAGVVAGLLENASSVPLSAEFSMSEENREDFSWVSGGKIPWKGGDVPKRKGPAGSVLPFLLG